MSERKEPDLKTKIMNALQKNGGEDSNFIHAVKFHLTVLANSKPEDEIESRQEVWRYLLSKLFLDKMDLYPNQPFKCKLNEYSDWPLAPLPVSLFGKKTDEATEKKDEDGKFWFYESLKIGDVLDCRVSEVLPGAYQLRVIHKYGAPSLLDDLKIIVSLLFAKSGEAISETPLLLLELVRVAVYDLVVVSDVVQAVYVTADPVDFKEFSTLKLMPKLGRITQDDMPSYVFETPDKEKFPSYSDYLISKPQFHNPHFYNGLMEKCGIDPKTVCSFFPDYNRKPCTESQTGQALLKESKLTDAKVFANLALKSLDDKKYEEALKNLEKALKICPQDDSLMSKLYDIRSDIYSQQMKTSHCLKALCDLEMAFKLAPEDDTIKQKIIHQIFKVANSWYRLKQYKKAVKGFEFVLEHDTSHRLAARALDHIKTKYADQLLNLEEMSQIDLQEKKKELLTELKKMKTL